MADTTVDQANAIVRAAEVQAARAALAKITQFSTDIQAIYGELGTAPGASPASAFLLNIMGAIGGPQMMVGSTMSQYGLNADGSALAPIAAPAPTTTP